MVSDQSNTALLPHKPVLFIGEGGGGGLLALGWNCSQWVKVRIIFSQKTPAVSRSSQPLAIEPGPVGGFGLGEVLGTTKFQ